MNRPFKFTVAVLVVAAGIASGAVFQITHHLKAPVPVARAQSGAKLPEPGAAPVVAPAAPPAAVAALGDPIGQFKARITKKFFGTYITPQDSPVQPERFKGYHLGVDVEYGDVTGTVPVFAVTDGSVAYAGWVSGYGGVEVLHQLIRGAMHTVLYGHLDPNDLLAVGTKVTRGQTIGRLGVAYSHETDGERRHLHFSVRADDTVVLAGYVQSKNQLSGWIDPLSLY